MRLVLLSIQNLWSARYDDAKLFLVFSLVEGKDRLGYKEAVCEKRSFILEALMESLAMMIEKQPTPANMFTTKKNNNEPNQN